MILLIIFGTLFILGLIFIILGYFCRIFHYWETNDNVAIAGFVNIFVGGIGLLVCSIFAIANNCTIGREQIRFDYQEKINSLNNTKKALESQLESSTLTILEVSTYNNSVRAFKTELQTAQLLSKSPWVGCLCCQVCNEFSVDAVSYLYID